MCKKITQFSGRTAFFLLFVCMFCSSLIVMPLMTYGAESEVEMIERSLQAMKMITAGKDHSLILNKDGSLVAWGSNTDGQCNVPSGNDFVAVEAGWHHSLALKADGSVVAWGMKHYGQCNVPVEAQRDVIAISAGSYFSMALKVSTPEYF